MKNKIVSWSQISIKKIVFQIIIFIPGRCHIGVRSIQISRCLRPPRTRAPAIVAASAGSSRWSHGAALPVQRSASQLQLFPVHLLLFVTQQLVYQHAGEYAGQYTGHRDAEEGPQAVRQRAVHRFAVRSSLEQYAGIPLYLRRAVTRARSANTHNFKINIPEVCLRSRNNILISYNSSPE